MGGDKGLEDEGLGAAIFQGLQEAALRTARHPAVEQVGAVVMQLGLSYAAYGATLAVAHVAAGAARVHCATPLLGPLWGLASVSGASVAAGHVSRSTLAALRQSYGGGAPVGAGGGKDQGATGQRSGNGSGSVLLQAVASLPGQLLACWDVREAAVDAVLGPVVYRVLCRQAFRSLLPSHLAKPGAFARAHVPTSASEYATAAEKAELSVFFGRDGCHHCGTVRNGVIGDHMPPYKVVRDELAAREVASGLEKALAKIADAVGLKDTSLLQVYYAQCRDCSSRQALLMRHGTRTTALPGVWPPALVAHHPARLAARPSLPPLLVGLRYYIPAAVHTRPGGRGAGDGGSRGKARRGGKARGGGGRGGGSSSSAEERKGGERGQGRGRWWPVAATSLSLPDLFAASTRLLMAGADEEEEEEEEGVGLQAAGWLLPRAALAAVWTQADGAQRRKGYVPDISCAKDRLAAMEEKHWSTFPS